MMNRKRMVRIRILLLAALLLGLLLPGAGVVVAQTGAVAPAINGPDDPAELEAFLDELFARDMEEHHIAGAAISVVKDGELVLAKGYGYADLENGIPVDPEQTGFLIGSVTKLFTLTPT